mmetsp:Transcript_40026/g.74367  ORF Transcript_40026/g.74367 Transcript_40026/m.74367 type:complete len:91 (-) Transcript_40026:14-286(-)
MREQTTGLPVCLKLQGVRPLEPEDVNFSPSLSRRRQLPTLHSLLPQLPETNEEDDCETMSIFCWDSVSKQGIYSDCPCRSQSLPGAWIHD